MSTWLSTPSSANAASVVGSGLRSAYWLWLEDDDRAMAMLRIVLEQTARLKTWREKPEKARELESRDSTTPRDWLEKAGWRRLTALNRALGEFAHTKSTSRWAGARELLARLQPDVDQDRAIYTARGAAVDFVASLVASEAIEQLKLASPTVADAVAEMFVKAGVAVADPTDRDVERLFNHIWSQRTNDLGTPDFAGAAEQQDWAKRRKPAPSRLKLHGQPGQGGAPHANGPTSSNPFVKPA
jgi:hypothetical protein